MAHLFLSYAREDRECARRLADALTSRGWSVWWDREIPVGGAFSQVIEQELERARCVIVLWSRHSVTSNWVRNEASEAVQRNVLVPVRIEDVRQPIDFRHLQTADLFSWQEGFASPDFDACLSSIEMLVRKTADRERPDQTLELELPKRPPEKSKADDDFLISQDGKQFRAPDAATLRRWAAEGRVRDGSFIYHPSFGRWIVARDVQSLQGAFPKPPPAPAPAPTPVRPPEPPRPAPPAAPKAYAIRQDGGEVTAPDLATLCVWAAEGRVQPESRVYDPRREAWVYAREIPEVQNAYRNAPRRDRPPVATRSRRPLFIMLGLGVGLVILMLVGLGAYREMASKYAADTAYTPPAPDTAAMPATISIGVENRCPGRTISVAICYLNASNTWITKGWFLIAPGETKPNLVEGVGPIAYFFGFSGDTTWGGMNTDPLTRVLPIDAQSAFDSPVDAMNGKTVTMVPFFGKRIDSGQPAYIQQLTCAQ